MYQNKGTRDSTNNLGECHRNEREIEQQKERQSKGGENGHNLLKDCDVLWVDILRKVSICVTEDVYKILLTIKNKKFSSSKKKCFLNKF